MFNFILRVFSPFKIIFPSYSYITHYMKTKNRSTNVTVNVFRILLIPHLFQTTKKESSYSAQHHKSFQSTWNDPLCSFTLHREVSGSAMSPVEGGGNPAKALPRTPAAPGPCCWTQLSCHFLTTVPQNNWIVPVSAPQGGQGLGWQHFFVFLQNSFPPPGKWLLPTVGHSCPASAHTWGYWQQPAVLAVPWEESKEKGKEKQWRAHYGIWVNLLLLTS